MEDALLKYPCIFLHRTLVTSSCTPVTSHYTWHHTPVTSHYTLVTPHCTLVTPHHILVTSHHILVTSHHILVTSHCTHQASLSCTILPHFAVTGYATEGMLLESILASIHTGERRKNNRWASSLTHQCKGEYFCVATGSHFLSQQVRQPVEWELQHSVTIMIIHSKNYIIFFFQ